MLLILGGAQGYTLYQNSKVQFAGKGSTGRTEALNKAEQAAMKKVISDPLKDAKQLNITMNDPRWLASDGWVKMARNIGGIEIHFVYNTITGLFDDPKFVGK